MSDEAFRSDRTLRTSEVAAQAGVNLQTLRYYERRGLLPEPARGPSGYRAYPPEAVQVVRFVKRAQALGFTLNEVQELLRLRVDPAAACAEVRAAARAKVAEIEKRIAALQAMQSALGALADSCKNDGSVSACPILAALNVDSGLGGIG